MSETVEDRYAPTGQFRVTYNWGVYRDFPTLPKALRFTATLLDEPTSDPCLRNVEVLDTTNWGTDEFLETIMIGERVFS